MGSLDFLISIIVSRHSDILHYNYHQLRDYSKRQDLETLSFSSSRPGNILNDHFQYILLVNDFREISSDLREYGSLNSVIIREFAANFDRSSLTYALALPFQMSSNSLYLLM
jgi:hypothetical protein